MNNLNAVIDSLIDSAIYTGQISKDQKIEVSSFIENGWKFNSQIIDDIDAHYGKEGSELILPLLYIMWRKMNDNSNEDEKRLISLFMPIKELLTELFNKLKKFNVYKSEFPNLTFERSTSIGKNFIELVRDNFFIGKMDEIKKLKKEDREKSLRDKTINKILD